MERVSLALSLLLACPSQAQAQAGVDADADADADVDVEADVDDDDDDDDDLDLDLDLDLDDDDDDDDEARGDQRSEELPLEELADEAADLEVLQNRKYDMTHEFSLLGGGLPADPFYKGYTVTAGYTWHLAQSIAWELLQFTYAFNFDTKLKKELARIAGVSAGIAPEFPEIQWVLASRLVLKPLYGKEAVFNTDTVHMEFFVAVGPATIFRGAPVNQLSFGGDVALGVRLWIAQGVSMRIDLGELIFAAPTVAGTEIGTALHLHLGFAFSMRGED